MSSVPVGFFPSINLSWKTDYPWEIALNQGDDVELLEDTLSEEGFYGKQDDDMNQLPHILDVQCTYQPIHDFIPQKSVQDSPFIVPKSYSKPALYYKDEQDWLDGGVETLVNEPKDDEE